VAKQFTLTLITDTPRSIDKVESDDLVHLLSQFQFVLISVIKKIQQHERISGIVDDDIPF